MVLIKLFNHSSPQQEVKERENIRWKKKLNLFSTSHQQGMSGHLLVSRASLGIAVLTKDNVIMSVPPALSLIAEQTSEWHGL